MKLTRWGYAKFPKAQTAYVAVVVPHMEDDKIEYHWVTTIGILDCLHPYKENPIIF